MPRPQFFILGTTLTGQTFRPSDWAERLAGVMSQFHPEGAQAGKIGYSPWCLPVALGDVKAVKVSPELEDTEPLAWDFVNNFARDNELQTEWRTEPQ